MESAHLILSEIYANISLGKSNLDPEMIKKIKDYFSTQSTFDLLQPEEELRDTEITEDPLSDLEMNSDSEDELEPDIKEGDLSINDCDNISEADSLATDDEDVSLNSSFSVFYCDN